MCKNFWWGQTCDKQKVALISWFSMRKPKKEGGLGFRSFRCFNLALLAKQGWRITQQQESLAARVLKARYFARGSLWEARRGHQPSFTWQSVLKGRKLLKEGCLWRVGDGTKIKVCADKWLPRSPNHMAQPFPQTVHRDATVSELINHEHRLWREQIIRNCFSHTQTEEILSIPLCQNAREDTLIWGETRDGVFTVRSATLLARRIEEAKKQPHLASCSGAFDGRWVRIWRAQAIPRAKNLCWRACRDAIPTRVNLYKRGMEIDVYCPVCGSDYETPSHTFLDCEFAMDFWRKSPFRLCTKSRSQRDFGAWCHKVISALDEEQRGLFITLIWGLWCLRNRWVFEGKREHVGTSLMRLVDSWRKYVEAKEAKQTKGKGTVTTASKWLPPERGLLKVNVDAAMGRESRRGVGVIARNSEGEIMVAAHKKVRAEWDVDTMEAFAVLKDGLKDNR